MENVNLEIKKKQAAIYPLKVMPKVWGKTEQEEKKQ
jgi:hypothetical protein